MNCANTNPGFLEASTPTGLCSAGSTYYSTWFNCRTPPYSEVLTGFRFVADPATEPLLATSNVKQPGKGWCIYDSDFYENSTLTSHRAYTPDTKLLCGDRYYDDNLFISNDNRCLCKKGMRWSMLGTNKNGQPGACVRTIDVDRRGTPPNVCQRGAGNPIYPLLGTKRESLDAGITLGGHALTFKYDTASAPWTSDGLGDDDSTILWMDSFHRRLQVSFGNPQLKAMRGVNHTLNFFRQGTKWIAGFDNRSSVNDQRDTLTETSAGGYLYRDQLANHMESYNGDGQLQLWMSVSGVSLMPVFSTGASSNAPTAGYLLTMQDPFGRAVGFSHVSHNTPRGNEVLVNRITDPAGQSIVVDRDGNGNIKNLTWQDSKVRTFIYDSPNANQSWALTGVVDESNKRYATFTYDADGRAISTEHAGGVDKYSVSYSNGTGPRVVVSEDYDSTANVIWRYHDWALDQPPAVAGPMMGSVENFSMPSLALKHPRDTGRQQPAGSGCGASSNFMDYDSNGNLSIKDDFNGKRSCYSNYLSRNLETARVEGLANTETCSTVTAAGASLPVGSRKISTKWHPDWAMKTQQAEPNLLTTWVYNGQPDPFNGGNIARCITATYGSTNNEPKLPDDKDNVVLCKKVEQATTDANGSQGLSPTFVTTANQVNRREWRYTYNQYGQMLTSIDPLGQATSYTYYCQDAATCDGSHKHVFTGTAPNEVGHYQGDLWKVTNAAGHVTEYLSYDRAGRVLSMKGANGLVTSYSYTPRGWISSENRGGLSTTYEYWPTGLLKKVTQPDQSYLYYKYDDAHRLTDVTDKVDASGNLIGNTVHYELDNAGNRKVETVKDASNMLTRNIERTYDALNRLHTVTGAQQLLMHQN